MWSPSPWIFLRNVILFLVQKRGWLFTIWGENKFKGSNNFPELKRKVRRLFGPRRGLASATLSSPHRPAAWHRHLTSSETGQVSRGSIFKVVESFFDMCTITAKTDATFCPKIVSRLPINGAFRATTNKMFGLILTSATPRPSNFVKEQP